MEAGSEICAQTLGRAVEVLLKRGRRDFRNQWGQGHHRETASLDHGISQSLNQQSGLWHGTSLGYLHIYVPAVQFDLFMRLLEMGAGIVLSALAGSLESISQAVLPCPALIQREVLDLMVAGYAVLTHGRPASF